MERLRWANEHKDWTIDDWKRVVWSDETKINRFGSDGAQWYWKQKGEPLREHHISPQVLIWWWLSHDVGLHHI